MSVKMPYTPFAERDSEYYRKLASLRKNPFYAFKEDPKFAKKASKLGVAAKKKKRTQEEIELRKNNARSGG